MLKYNKSRHEYIELNDFYSPLDGDKSPTKKAVASYRTPKRFAPHLLHFLWFFVLLCSFAFSSEKVKLQFVPNFPVEENIHMEFESHQNLPEFKIDSVSRQDLKAILKVSSKQSEVPLTHGPIDLIFTLKDLSIDVKMNDKSISYRINDPATSVETAELSKVIDRPIKLELDEKFVLKDNNPELKKLLDELPELNKVNYEKILREILLYVFALATKKLKPDATVDVNFPEVIDTGNKDSVNLTYTVTKLENDIVFSTISGAIQTKDKQLVNKLEISQGNEEKVFINVNVKITGQGQWNIKNALLHEIVTNFDLTGSMKIKNFEWPLSMKGTVSAKSQPVK